MSDPKMIKEIIEAVTIPVMAKVRIGHFVEAQIIESIGVDYIDESEVLTPADEANHINKHNFKVPYVCGAKNLGEALRRISEGAAFIRTKGEAGTGNVVEAVRHIRTVNAEIRRAASMSDEELYAYAKDLQAPYNLLKETAKLGRLPVVNFAAGGVATPADAALMMVSWQEFAYAILKYCQRLIVYVSHFSNWAVMVSSLVLVSSSLAIPPSAQRLSSKLSLTSMTPRSSLRSLRIWVRLWLVSTLTNFLKTKRWPSVAGKLVMDAFSPYI
jgi:SOR/SNZ family